LLRNRLILHFKNQHIDHGVVEKNLDVYVKDGGFVPEIIIVDGLGFANITPQDMKKWQELAAAYQTQIWFSATFPNNQTSLAEFIKPLVEYFAVVIELNARPDHIELVLVKDHDAPTIEKLRLRLDPKSLLISNRRV